MTTSELRVLPLTSALPCNKILFLDIDGPVIDLYTFKTNPYVSYYRTGCNATSVKHINKLCEQFDLKIVTNSMHNWSNVGLRSLKDDLISWGIVDRYFHTDWRTIFPNVDYDKVNSKVRGAGRLYAITEWLNKNPGHDWICFDDRKFTDDIRLIHIQRQYGIDEAYYEQAVEVLKIIN